MNSTEESGYNCGSLKLELHSLSRDGPEAIDSPENTEQAATLTMVASVEGERKNPQCIPG